MPRRTCKPIQIPVKYKEETLMFEGTTLTIAGDIVSEYNRTLDGNFVLWNGKKELWIMDTVKGLTSLELRESPPYLTTPERVWEIDDSSPSPDVNTYFPPFNMKRDQTPDNVRQPETSTPEQPPERMETPEGSPLTITPLGRIISAKTVRTLALERTKKGKKRSRVSGKRKGKK